MRSISNKNTSAAGRAAERSELAHHEVEEGEQRRETVRCSDETSAQHDWLTFVEQQRCETRSFAEQV